MEEFSIKEPEVVQDIRTFEELDMTFSPLRCFAGGEMTGIQCIAVSCTQGLWY